MKSLIFFTFITLMFTACGASSSSNDNTPEVSTLTDQAIEEEVNLLAKPGVPNNPRILLPELGNTPQALPQRPQENPRVIQDETEEENTTAIQEENPRIFDDVNISKLQLGEALFHDTSLSLTRNQSCASCHNPAQAFTDTRDNGVGGAVSLGDDDVSLGLRNAPMLTYAALIPTFGQNNNGDFVGGQFWDGRANDLTEQAKGPFLNPVEMQMPDVASVIARVNENSTYIEAFETLYGAGILADEEAAFEALADAIATFQSNPNFATFDAKLDRREALTAQEQLGQTLFRQNRCVTCHSDRGNNALFTNFEYENIGVPKNASLFGLNGTDEDFVDHGLLENPNVNDNNQDGRFRTPSLRNVAVTAPYMHNGVFKELKTVVHFYNTRDVAGAINPETGLEWEASEVRRNRVGGNRVGNLGLTDAEEDAIVAFLKTLTDERFEPLIP